MTSTSNRLGVDIGGTFTDLVLETENGQFSTKILTTHSAPENAILTGLEQICAEAGILPCHIAQIIHGTTLATNALIERRGAKTALITTQGFRDVLEMRNESRFEQYDLNLTLPDPLLARQHRYVVEERISARGDILIPLNRDSVEQCIEAIAQAGYQSIAVGLLHSYVNDAHEKQVRDAIKARLPSVMVSLSCEVSPQMREYERFNTVAANAYIKPLMKSYLDRLKGRLAEQDVSCPVFLMHSGGGIISLESAAEFPVRLVESGPAGGAVFAAHFAARYQLNKVLSFDMGGTTAKICLIKNQTPQTSRVFEVARTYRFKKGSGMPISIPVIDMVEIGAGGGSLAHVDALQQIRVGPQSAGSEPGPACYGRGGEHPAVSDADLLLGRLDAAHFAGGSIVLDETRSVAAIKTVIGEPLDMTVEEAAFGISEMVDENMANAARVHAVENGDDLADYTMIAFGGAAPLHAARLCEKLGITRLLVPPGAGVGSAIGFLRAPFSFEANRSLTMALKTFSPLTVTHLFADLEAEAVGFVRQCDSESDIKTLHKIYMRYQGQGWEIPIDLSGDDAKKPDTVRFKALFEAQYIKLFGRSVQGIEIEITGWSVQATTALPPVATVVPKAPETSAEASADCQIFDPALGRILDGSTYQRDKMASASFANGPARIVESETTLIVPESRCVICQADGCLDVRVKAEGSQND